PVNFAPERAGVPHGATPCPQRLQPSRSREVCARIPPPAAVAAWRARIATADALWSRAPNTRAAYRAHSHCQLYMCATGGLIELRRHQEGGFASCPTCLPGQGGQLTTERMRLGKATTRVIHA